MAERKRKDYVQPVDAGLGRQVKSEIGKAFEEWLEGADNLTLWEEGHGIQNENQNLELIIMNV